MEHSPPPFFKRGPAPLVRLFFFASMSLALLVVDARFRYAEGLRSGLALVAYPLQRAATAPIDFFAAVGAYFSTQAQLVEDNAALRARALALAHDAQRAAAAEAELTQLRRLISAGEKLPVKSTPAEVIYASRDPYAHRIFINGGSQHGITPGSPVADESGLVGQVTRVHALLSEVTLITDQDQAIPVQVVRSGLRAIAFGAGPSGMMELRFMASNAEIQAGDDLVTSGIDGTYPAGLPVAKVVRIERDAELSFTRVVCKPTAGVDRGRYVLVLSDPTVRPPRPEAKKDRRAEKAARRSAKSTRSGEGKDQSGDGAR
jgi:rod shape-determining protein MreC